VNKLTGNSYRKHFTTKKSHRRLTQN